MTPRSPGLLPATLPMRPVEAMRSLQKAGNQDRQALSGHSEEKEKRCPTSLLPIDGPLTFLCFNYKCKFIIPKVTKLLPSIYFALRPSKQLQHWSVPIHVLLFPRDHRCTRVVVT